MCQPGNEESHRLGGCQSVAQLDFYTFFRELLRQISFLYFPDRGCNPKWLLFSRQGVRPQPVSYNTFFAKNSPRHSPILEEKPRRNKYIFGANTKIINLYTTLQLFHKKNIVQDFLMYNEFDPKHYKGKWPCTTKTLYNENSLIGRLHKYFLNIMQLFLFLRQKHYFY